MNGLREMRYTEFQRLAEDPSLQFLPPILRIAGDSYFIMARHCQGECNLNVQDEICCVTVSKPQFEELKRIRESALTRNIRVYTQETKSEDN